MFEKRYKLKDLYVSRIGRVTKEVWREGKTFLDGEIYRHIEYDGPVGIFLKKGKAAKRVSTDVEYYLFDGVKYPKEGDWFVKNLTPITQAIIFKEGVVSITKRDAYKLEKMLEKAYADDQTAQKPQNDEQSELAM